ncbi:MAG: hypothetical protein AAGB93_00195 [Planctomycetota bacterium]
MWRPELRFDLVEEHFDELDFLCEQREANLATPDWTLQDLGEHEARMEAHLDGLRVAGETGRELARERLVGDEPSASAAAALVLLSSGSGEPVDAAFECFRGDAPEAVEGLRRALRMLGIAGHVDRLRALAASEDEAVSAAACDVLAFHREGDFPCARLLGSASEDVRRIGLGALGRTGRITAEELAAALAEPSPLVRRAALEAAARAGLSECRAHCLSAATRRTDPDPECVRFLGVLGGDGAGADLVEALDRPEVAADAVAALGALGSVEHVPLLLDLMEHDDLGPDAVEAYRRITGADDVEGHLPVPREPVGEEEDERDVLPPDPEKARADWERREGALTPNACWQEGLRIDAGELPPAFDSLSLRARRDVFLRARSSNAAGVDDLELEAPAARQVRV